MNTIILAGSPWSEIEIHFNHLKNLGISDPYSIERHNKLNTIRSLHDQIFYNHQEHQNRQIELGKPWEQAAGELFLANWQQPVWGWADTRSIWLLDFWRDFDPQTRFILVHTQPQQALAKAMAQVDQDVSFDVDQFISDWLAYEREMLRFYLRNQQRCLLVDSKQIAANPVGLALACNERWGFELSLDASDLQDLNNSSELFAYPLTHLLAHEVLNQYPETHNLQLEISTSLLSIQPEIIPANDEQTLELSDAIINLRSLIYNKNRALADKVQSKQELEQFSQKTQSLEAELEAIGADLSEKCKLVEEHEALIDRYQQEQDNQISQTTNLRQENELLLQQLHQVQEELEQYFQKTQSLETELEAIGANFSKKCKLVEEHEALIDRYQQEQDNQISHTTNLHQENERLLLQLHQVQEELEQYFLKAQALESELQKIGGDLTNKHRLLEEYQAQLQRYQQEQDNNQVKITEYCQQIEQLTQECKAISKLAEERQLQINHLQGESESQINTTTHLRQENELLLLQLHQVQEELEHYFLQHQQEQKLREEANQRLVRVYARWPDFVDMSSLRISSIDEKNARGIVLTATDVYHSSRLVEEFKFSVQIQKNKIPAIVIERNETGKSGSLMRWPVQLANKSALVIPAKSSKGAAGTSVLAASDWQLLQAMTQTCADSLQCGAFQLEDAIDGFDAAIWQKILLEMNQSIKAESNSLRYDSVKLKRKKVNPDYEYLWLQISNLNFNGKQWPQAEFRFSASAVKRQGFSMHPKLEFIQAQTGWLPLLESWKPELEDEYGLRMEFRCEIESQAVDIGFWNSLTDADRVLILALIWHLPIFLADLEAQNTAINRPWEDWQKLAKETMATIKARVLELGII